MQFLSDTNGKEITNVKKIIDDLYCVLKKGVINHSFF